MVVFQNICSNNQFAPKKQLSFMEKNPQIFQLVNFLVSKDYKNFKHSLDSVIATRIESSLPTLKCSSLINDLCLIEKNKFIMMQPYPHTYEDISPTVSSFKVIESSEVCSLGNTNRIELSLLYGNIKTNEFLSEILFCISEVAFKYNLSLCESIITRLLLEVESVVLSMSPLVFLHAFSGYCLMDVTKILFRLQQNSASFFYVKNATKDQKQAYFAYLVKISCKDSNQLPDLKKAADEFCDRSSSQSLSSVDLKFERNTDSRAISSSNDNYSSIVSIPEMYLCHHDESSINNKVLEEIATLSDCPDDCKDSCNSVPEIYPGCHDSIDAPAVQDEDNISSTTKHSCEKPRSSNWDSSDDGQSIRETTELKLFALEMERKYPMPHAPTRPFYYYTCNRAPYLEEVFDKQVNSINQEEINSFSVSLNKY